MTRLAVRGLHLDFAEIDVADLASLLRRPLNDDRVVAFLGALVFKIRRSAYYGFVALENDGVDVVFNEAPWVIPEAEITDPKRLYLSAFHLHREGHEGYAEFKASCRTALPSEIQRQIC
jgi:hypothetical protein